MKNGLIYLCGPISGLSHNDARYSWRQYVTEELSPHGITCLSPMRHKDHLKKETFLHHSGYEGNPLSNAKGITTRDRFDTQRSDLIFCNLLNADRISIGSVIEFGWADSMRIPIILCMEDEGNVHEHCIIREIANFIVPTLQDGVKVAKAVLVPTI